MPAARMATRRFSRGLMFHRFRADDGPVAWQGALTAGELEKILLRIGIEHIRSPADWLERLQTGRLAAQDVCITFDDALRCQFDIALPILQKHGLTAFWFVYSSVFEGIPVRAEIYSYVAGQIGGMEHLITQFLRRCPAIASPQLASSDFMDYSNRMRQAAPYYTGRDIAYRYLRNCPENASWFEPLMDRLVEENGFRISDLSRDLWLTNDHLVALTAAGHQIGLHSYDHPYDIATLNRAEQHRQYYRNFEHIRHVTGRVPLSVAHPLNSYNEVSLAVLRELGIQCGFRANLCAPRNGSLNPDALELAREDSSKLLLETRSE